MRSDAVTLMTLAAQKLKVVDRVVERCRGTTYTGYTGILETASPSVTASPSDRLTTLARAVVRLSPSHRDPEQFHEDKSEIAAELRRLAREIAA